MITNYIKKLVSIVFPDGNKWFYILILPWFVAMGIFLISFPAILTACGMWYEHETGISVDFNNNDLIKLSGALHNFTTILWRIFGIFITISAFSDAYSINKNKHSEGYL
jgi:hypothetical protein